MVYNSPTSSSVTAPSAPFERTVEAELGAFLSAARQSACCAVQQAYSMVKWFGALRQSP
jgi:hypothetical protein